jgi:hypothetical protein
MVTNETATHPLKWMKNALIQVVRIRGYPLIKTT